MEIQDHVDTGGTLGLGEGDVHRLLTSERRRLTLEILVDGGPRTLEALAEEIVRRERHGDVTEHAVSRTMVDLYHRHLPLMADLEAIDFDRREKCVVDCWVESEVT